MEDSSSQHDAYAALRVPAFRRLLIGGTLVRIGTSGQTLAIGWEMYSRTDDPLMLGLVGLAQAIPMLLLTLPAGYLADVFNRKKLIILSLVLATATSLGLAAFSYFRGPIALMFVMLFLDSCALRLGWPARSALLPLIVPRETFENAVKWRTSLGQISGLVGPAVGGFIIDWSLPAAYVVAACSSTLFIFLLLAIHVPDGKRAMPGRMLAKLGEGVRFVWQKKVLLGAISLDLFGVLLGGAVYLLPIFARDIIDVRSLGLSPEQALGWLRAAPAAGALVMALYLAHSPPLRRAGRTMLLAVAGFGLATILFGISRNFWLSLFLLAVTGAADNISVVVRQTLVQLWTPNEMRGRVSAVSAVFISSSNDLGGFESGLVARLFTPIFSVVSGGMGTILIVLAWAGLFPGLRKIDRLADQEDSASVAAPPGQGGNRSG